MAQRNQHIADRIIKSDFVRWKSFKFLQPEGFKELTTDAYQKLRHSITENDFVESFKIWESNGNLYCLDGFHRCKVLDILEGEGWDVPEKFRADFVKCKSRKEAKKLVLIYSSIYARVVDEGLYEFAQDLNWDDTVQSIDIPDIDLSVFEQEYFGDTTPEEDTEVGDLIDQAEELNKKWQVKPGDLWQLKEHRLLCGDATKQEDVERLLQNEKPEMMVTDPPYGVNYDPKWRTEAAKQGLIAFASAREGRVMSDDKMDWSDAFSLFSGDVAYVWHAGRYAVPAIEALEKCKFEVRTQIIWRKPAFVISRGNYHWQHEPCWYAVRKGKTAMWCGDRSQSTIWDINPNTEDRKNFAHATMKPLECMERPIRNHKAENIYEPFCGTGTTIIASEKQERRCFALEIHPPYCSVVLERYYQFTQNKPKRIT